MVHQQQNSSSGKPSSSLSRTSKKTASRKKRVPQYAKLPGSLGGSGGYAGDMDSQSTDLPASIELTSSRPKKRYNIINVKPLYPDGKRPKPSKEELNFLASDALEEMKKDSINPKSRRPHVFQPNQK